MCFGSISVSCNSLREADFLFVFFLEREVRNSVVNKVERLLCAFFLSDFLSWIKISWKNEDILSSK